jgi:hypothetical protein
MGQSEDPQSHSTYPYVECVIIEEFTCNFCYNHNSYDEQDILQYGDYEIVPCDDDKGQHVENILYCKHCNEYYIYDIKCHVCS